MGIFTNIFKKKANNLSDYQIETIKRQITIMSESVNLVNDSNNLDVVLRRYNILCETIQRLIPYTDTELQEAGYQLKEPLADTLGTIQKNKIIIINQAIERNIRSEIDSLQTTKGKLNKLEILYKNFYERKDLSPENVSFLIDLYGSISNDLYDIAESEE